MAMVDETQKTLVVNIDTMLLHLLQPHMQGLQTFEPCDPEHSQLNPDQGGPDQGGHGPAIFANMSSVNVGNPVNVAQIMRFIDASCNPHCLLSSDVNASAAKYFYVYKGLLVVELQSKVRRYVAEQLANDAGADDPLIERIDMVANSYKKGDHREVVEKVLGTTGYQSERDAREHQVKQIKEVVHTLRQELGVSSL